MESWMAGWEPGIPLLIAVFVGLVGYLGAKYTRRKEKAEATKADADAAAVITDSALEMMAERKAEAIALKIEMAEVKGSLKTITNQVVTLHGQVLTLQGDNASLAARVAQLESEKLQLQADNMTLRDRVAVLENQLRDLGHTPMNGHAVPGLLPSTVTTSTTEVRTVTPGEPNHQD